MGYLILGWRDGRSVYGLLRDRVLAGAGVRKFFFGWVQAGGRCGVRRP
jgi:hypothetical protein